MTNLLAGYLFPHPPMMIPEIGGKEIGNIKDTFNSAIRASKNIKMYNPDTIIIITPHGPVFRDGICISTTKTLKGDFSNFGVSNLNYSFENNIELVQTIIDKANEQGILTAPLDNDTAQSYGVSTKLDHGTLVPLHFISEEVDKPFKLVHITMGLLPYDELYDFGKILKDSLDKHKQMGIVIASGDLSHRLTPDAPAGYNPSGKEFDEKLVNALSDFDIETIMNMDTDLVDKAGECGLRPIIILIGALDGLNIEANVFSYEGPFGVGYCIAEFGIKEGGPKQKQKKESPYVSLAKKSLETYVKKGLVIDTPEGLPSEFYNKKAGAFVTIKIWDQLRGCIGTISPTRDCIAREIIENAISAGCGDPRFPSVEEKELHQLQYSVDILLEPEHITSIKELDPKRFGVIVRKGSRTGLLLPNLEGVDTAEEQVAIACQKAGIDLAEEFELERFEVIRHF
ncbi:MAG TPA: AmmeMemoRadiSam system protein A [Thermoanaerobacterales bacterium]|nr:AmmeMemoRadiSam system protein A [Thermoanaerobacterales bacterium]